MAVTDGEGALRWATRHGFKDIADGTSISILLTENGLGVAWAAEFPSLTTARSSSSVVGINRPALSFRDMLSNIGLTSEHPSGANVSLVDGSMHFLNYGLLADAVWINLMWVKDGKAVSVS